MSEPSAKLRVKVTLHRDLPVEPMPPLQRAKTPVSKLKFMLVLLALVAAGFWGWQQLNNHSAMAEPSGVADDVVAGDDIRITPRVVDDADPTRLQSSKDAARNNIVQPTDSNSLPPQIVAVQNSTPLKTAAKPISAAEHDNTDIEHGRAQVAAAETGMQHSTQIKALPDTTKTENSIKLPEGFSRIVLAADMEQLEPGAPVAQLVAKKDIQRLYLFTELKGYAGQQLRHRWSYQGLVQTEALLTIEDSPWRTYSEKWLLPDQLGAWRVEIIDQQQNVLYSHDFQYQ